MSRSALVSHSAQRMYELVNDIEAYPQFLPWCSSSKIVQKGQDELCASIDIAHAGLHKSFTTCNKLVPDQSITMQLVEGPFQHLLGNWRFHVLSEDACKVTLDMEFSFSSKLIAMAMGPIFNKICDTLVDAFCRRADEIYG